MPDPINTPRGVTLETEDPFEQELFEKLGSIPQHEPSERLRRAFYRDLSELESPQSFERVSRPSWFQWLLQPGLPALATLVVGLFIGTQLGDKGQDQGQLESLRAEVATLNATVALSLMERQSAAERLKGVDTATTVAGANPRITEALLLRAANDSSRSVRTAAIGALGPQMSDPGVAAEVQRLMLESHSPLVQLAFAELVMRWGDNDQLRNLVEAAEGGLLLPDVQQYVIEKVQRMSA
jgi:hypothetical protein